MANHTNWWDGFLAYLVSRRLGRRFQVLMEAEHLARYRAFLRVGALPMHRGLHRQAVRDLEKAAGYLDRAAAMWIFPQGSRRPPDEPLQGIERGAAQLALLADEPPLIVPVALRYRFRSEQLPEAFVLAAPPITASRTTRVAGRTARASLTEDIEQAMRDAIGDLDRQLEGESVEGFDLLVEGQLSINKRLDRLRHRLGMLDGDFDARNG